MSRTFDVGRHPDDAVLSSIILHSRRSPRRDDPLRRQQSELNSGFAWRFLPGSTSPLREQHPGHFVSGGGLAKHLDATHSGLGAGRGYVSTRPQTTGDCTCKPTSGRGSMSVRQVG